MELVFTYNSKTGVRLTASLFISVDSFKTSLLIEDGEDSYTTTLEPTADPFEAVKAAKLMVCHALREKELFTEALSVGERVEADMMKSLREQGFLKNYLKYERDYENAIKALFDQELPYYIGGIPLKGFDRAENPQERTMEWYVKWEDKEESLALKLSLPMDLYDLGARTAVKNLKGQLQEKVAKLRRENPGDYEVECIDATGEEHRFDVGMTYMAEDHTDKDMIWIYDRFGDRVEFGSFRFKKVEKLRVKVDRNRFKIPGPGDKIRLLSGWGETPFFEHKPGEKP